MNAVPFTYPIAKEVYDYVAEEMRDVSRDSTVEKLSNLVYNAEMAIGHSRQRDFVSGNRSGMTDDDVRKGIEAVRLAVTETLARIPDDTIVAAGIRKYLAKMNQSPPSDRLQVNDAVLAYSALKYFYRFMNSDSFNEINAFMHHASLNRFF